MNIEEVRTKQAEFEGNCVCHPPMGALQNSRIPDENVLESRYIGWR